MNRRGWTVLIGSLLVAALTALLSVAPVPYVQMEPGPTYDTLGQDGDGRDLIVISGAPVSQSQGQLRFVTVGLQPRVTLLEAIIGWLRDDYAVVPRELYYAPGQTEEEVNQQNQAVFVQTESTATVLALAELGHPWQIEVGEVAAGLPADGKLQPGDVIVSINGEPIETPKELFDLIRSGPVGTTLVFSIRRDGADRTVSMPTVAGEDGTPRVGFVPTITSSAPFTVEIPIEGVGGPSAGLLLSLGIIDKLDPEDLTGGKIIAGTGGICGPLGPALPASDPDYCPEIGRVLRMGGLAQKMAGARAAGAEYFLTPAENCSEAIANRPEGLTLVRVQTLSQALDELAKIRTGGTPTTCS